MNQLDYLPFIVRLAVDEEMDKVRALRKKGYGDAHGPEFGEAAAADDGLDANTYVAVSKQDNSFIGTIRFHTNAQGEPLPLEHLVDLPPEFRYVVTAEATRLVAPRSPTIQQALFKLFYHWCIHKVHARFMVVSAREEIAPLYRWLCFEQLLPDAVSYLGRPHWIFVRGLKGVETGDWAYHRLAKYMFDTTHPDIIV